MIIQSLYSDQKQKTTSTGSGVIQPLISPSTPIAPKKVQVSEPLKPVAEKKNLIANVWDTITGLDTKKIGEYLKTGVKTAPSIYQKGFGILIQNYVDSTRKKQQTYEKIFAKIQPKAVTEQRAKLIEKTTEPLMKKIEATGKTMKETGFQKQKTIIEEFAKTTTPSTGLQGFLEQVAFNLPQMASSTGLAVGIGIVTKNPILASSVALSTSYSLNASEVYQEARQSGLTDEEAMPLATLGGVVIGALDFIPMGRLIRKTGAIEPIKKTIIKRIISGMVDTAVQTGTEGVTEGLQEIIGGVIAKTYNENRDIFEGATTATLIGMLFGGVSNVTVAGIMGIKGKMAGNQDVIKDVETKVGDALNKSPEERTPEEKEIANAVLTQTLTPDQAMTYVLENGLANSEIGNKIVRAVAEAKTLNQNIKISPTADEKSLNIELIEPTQAVEPIKKEVSDVVPGEKEGLETTTEGQVTEKEPIPTELEPLTEEARVGKVLEGETKEQFTLRLRESKVINKFIDDKNGIKILDIPKLIKHNEKVGTQNFIDRPTLEFVKGKIQRGEPIDIMLNNNGDLTDGNHRLRALERMGYKKVQIRELVGNDAKIDTKPTAKNPEGIFRPDPNEGEHVFRIEYQSTKGVESGLTKIEPEVLKKELYDPKRLELRIMRPGTFGNPSDKWELQVRYKGFASDKLQFDTKAGAESAMKTYEFKGMTTNVGGDYVGSRFEDIYKSGLRPKKLGSPQITAKPVPSPTPKKVSKVEPKKPTPPVKTSIVTGERIREIPSVRIEKTWKTITRNGKLSLNTLNYIRVKDGKSLMTDLEISVGINTNQKDGMYQVVGNDMIPIDPRIAEDFPNIPTEPVGEKLAQSLPENLAQVLKDATFSTSTDETRPVLTGVRFEIGKTKLRVISTDGFRLYNKSIGIKSLKEGKFTIGAVKKLNQILGDITKGGEVVAINYDAKGGQVSFTNDNGIVAVRALEGDYPDYEKIYPETNRKIVLDKKEFDDALKTLAPYAKEGLNIVSFSIEPTKVVMKAKNITADVEKVVEVRIKDSITDDVKGAVEGSLVMPVRVEDQKNLAFNYRFMQDAIKTLEGNDVYLSYFVDNKGVLANSKPIPISDQEEKVYQVINKPVEEIETKKKPELSYEESANPILHAEMDIKRARRMMKENPARKDELTKYVKEVQDWINKKKGRKGVSVSGKNEFDMDRFTDIKNLADQEGYYKAIQFPEIVQLMRELLGSVPSVKYPRIRPSIGGRPLGLFHATEGSKMGAGITLNPDIFKSPEQAVKVFAHEVGHMADWLPDYTLKRGNLVGHIASMNHFLRNTFSGYIQEERVIQLTEQKKGLQEKRRGLRIEKRIGGTEDKQYLEEIKFLNKEIKKIRDNPKLVLANVKNELKSVTQTWKPFDDDNVPDSYLKYRYSAKELYADAVSMLFNDPQLLKQTAPTFWQGFFDAIDKKPDFKKVFFETMDLLNKGEPAILSAREKNIREMFQKGEDLHKVKLLEKTQKENDIVFRLKHELIDRNQRVIDDVNKAIKAGKAVADEDNPVYFLEESNYVGGKVKAWLERNIQPVYTDLRINEVAWDDFGEILFLERVINERGGTRNPIDYIRKHMPEVYDRIKAKLSEDIESKGAEEQTKFLIDTFGQEITGGLPLGIANPLGYDVETAQKQLDYLKNQLGSKYKVIEKNLPVFRKAIKDLIPEAYEAQLYKREIVEKIMANPAYATFQVLDYMDTFIPASIKHQMGTLKDVANPAGSTILKAISTIRAIEKNKSKLALVEFYKKTFPEDIKPAKTIWTGRANIPVESRDSDFKLLTLVENGTFTGYYTDPYIADTVMGMGTGRVNAVISILRFMNGKLFRPLFITYNLGFQTFNLIRDFSRFFKNIPGMTLPRAIKRYSQAIKPAIGRAWDISNELITEMEDKKILAVTYNDVVAGLTDEDKQVDFVLKSYGLQKDEKAKRGLFKIPLAILEQIEKTGNFIETLPKVAGYIELNGKMPSKQLGSFIRTSVGSPDFLRKGAGYSWYNEVFLFSNAIKEGVRADYNVAFKNPKTRGGYWWKTAGFTLLPKMIMYAGMLGLFGGSVKRMLEDASEYDRTNYIIVPLGRDKNGRTIYLRIPQDETGRFIGGFFWKSLMLLKQKKLGFSDIAEIFSYTGGQVPGLTPSLTTAFGITQFLAGQNPYDFFRGRNVIPDTEFKAGGTYALKPFASWVLNQVGGGIFWKSYVSQQTPESRTWIQKIIEAPLVSNILGRWIKVSDYGQKEANRKVTKQTEKEESVETIRRRELLDKYIELYRKDPGQKDDLADKLIYDVLGHESPENSDEKTLRTNTLKKFDVGIFRGESDVNLTSLIDADTNVEKVAILKRLQTVMDKEVYEKLIETAIEFKIVSEDAIEKSDLQSGIRQATKSLARLFNMEVQASELKGKELAFAGTPREEEVYNKMKSDWVSGEASLYNPKNPAETRPGGSGIGAYGRPVESGSVAFGNRVFQEALKKGEMVYIKVRGFEDVKTPYGDGVFRIDDTMNVRYSQKGQFNIDFNASDLDKARTSQGRFPIKFKIVEPNESSSKKKELVKTYYA